MVGSKVLFVAKHTVIELVYSFAIAGVDVFELAGSGHPIPILRAKVLNAGSLTGALKGKNNP